GRAIYNIDVQEEDEQHKKRRCDLFDDPAQEPPVYKIRRFEMIKYLFVQEEEYVAINEYEYDDFTRTNEDACHAYQEIFRNMDEVCASQKTTCLFLIRFIESVFPDINTTSVYTAYSLYDMAYLADSPVPHMLSTGLNTAYPGFGIRRIDFLTSMEKN
ncbi:hypothetical protein Tco_0160374, partial [Tanacetum coccineum]